MHTHKHARTHTGTHTHTNTHEYTHTAGASGQQLLAQQLAALAGDTGASLAGPPSNGDAATMTPAASHLQQALAGVSVWV